MADTPWEDRTWATYGIEWPPAGPIERPPLNSKEASWQSGLTDQDATPDRD